MCLSWWQKYKRPYKKNGELLCSKAKSRGQPLVRKVGGGRSLKVLVFHRILYSTFFSFLPMVSVFIPPFWHNPLGDGYHLFDGMVESVKVFVPVVGMVVAVHAAVVAVHEVEPDFSGVAV